jgi:hypothetical protein
VRTPVRGEGVRVSALQTIPGYDQAPPSEESALQALSELMGHEQASQAWAKACRAAAVRQPVVALGDLRQVADQLAQDAGLARVAGRCLVVRITSYTVLARNAGVL